MQREQFTFFRSFLEGISVIKNKAARCDAYDAIVLYALTGEEPDLSKIPAIAQIAFIMARPNIDASRKRAEAGRKGGSVGLSESRKQTGSKPEANAKQDKEEDKEEEEGKEQLLESGHTLPVKEAQKSRTIFRPPTVDEVAAYCLERGNNVDPQRFCDFYASKGWLVGKSKMKDWRAAVRNWENREGSGQKTAAGGFLNILEDMRGGDEYDTEGNGGAVDVSRNVVPIDFSWPDS